MLEPNIYTANPWRERLSRICHTTAAANKPSWLFFTIGQRCVEPTAGLIEAGLPASCFSQVMGSPIGFWNDSHMSTQFYQIIASAVLDQLSGKINTSKSQHVGDYDLSLVEVEDFLTSAFID
jgi:hypothetical protein